MSITKRKSCCLSLRNKEAQNLMRRYLLWAYKTTKEDLDWIDRKFTQLEVDEQILKQLTKSLSSMTGLKRDAFSGKINEFQEYMLKKKDRGLKEKFLDSDQKDLQPQYVYLHKRLSAIEKTIRTLLGSKELTRIRLLYEQEMTRRILEAKEHH